MTELLILGVLLGFCLGFFTSIFMIFIIPSEAFKAIVKNFWNKIKKFWKRLGEILLQIGNYVATGDTEPPKDDTSEAPPVIDFTWAEQTAERLGVKLNPNAEHRGLILEGLKQNIIKYGKQFCPCANMGYYDRADKPRPETLVCPCFAMRTGKQCQCGLFMNDTAISHPGMKYVTDEETGRIVLAPMDGSEGPEAPWKDDVTSPEEEQPKYVSITASTKEPIPHVYDCIDLHQKKEDKKE